MSAVAKPEPIRLATDEYRWSLASKCPRWAVLHRRKAPASLPSERQLRIMRRGKLFEDLVAEQFTNAYGAENVQRQREVVWPGGILHADLFVVAEAATIEVKSSTSPESLRVGALLQNGGEQLFDPESERGALVWIDPVDLDQILEPVVVTADLRGRVAHVVEQLAWAEKDPRNLPDCTACSPTECRMKGCTYTDVAWEGWTRPPFLPLDGRKADLVRELYETTRQRSGHAAEARALKVRLDEITTALVDLGLDAGQEYAAGPLRLKAVQIRGRETFSITRAREHGAWDAGDDERLGAFLNRGEPHLRWYINRVGEEPLLTADDFGDDVPF